MPPQTNQDPDVSLPISTQDNPNLTVNVEPLNQANGQDLSGSSLPTTGPSQTAEPAPITPRGEPEPYASTTPAPNSPVSTPTAHFLDSSTFKPAEPGVPVVGYGEASSTIKLDAKRASRRSKISFGLLGGLVLLAGIAAAFYFGYYMNPSVIWSQSLGNMNKGYSQLVSYLDTSSATHYKGLSETGSFKLSMGGQSYNGSLNALSDGSNSTLTANLDLGITKLDFEERSIKAAGNSEPDVYLQLNGIKPLTNLLTSQSPEPLVTQIGSLDGQWISIDHNLIADIQHELTQNALSSGTPTLTWADISSFLNAATPVNKQYVFNANKATAVTTVLKTYGKQKIDGHTTEHYEVGFVKANVKAYITAMCAALQESGLGKYIAHFTGKPVGTSSTCKDMETSTDNIKSTDTIDVWADLNTRLIYKLRVSAKDNPAENYVDIGLNYKGGDSYPLFVSGLSGSSSSSTTFSSILTLNQKTHGLSVALNVASNDKTNPLNLNGSLTLVPNNNTVNVTVPTGAKPITGILQGLGLGQYLTQLQQLGSNAKKTSSPLLDLRFAVPGQSL